jgi:hypothetical protein
MSVKQKEQPKASAAGGRNPLPKASAVGGRNPHTFHNLSKNISIAVIVYNRNMVVVTSWVM